MSDSIQNAISTVALPPAAARGHRRLRHLAALGRSRFSSALTIVVDVFVEAQEMARAAHRRFPSA
jgi:hypothetical protein